MSKHLFFSFLFSLGMLFLTGCLTLPRGYTPSAKLMKNVTSQKYDVTYSLSYIADGDVAEGSASEAQLRKFIEKGLKNSGCFSTVSYKNPGEMSGYHIHFIAHYSSLPVNEATIFDMTLGYTLFLIPCWQSTYLDLSAVLMYEKKKVHSCSTSEELRTYFWLPLAPLGVLWNDWIAWTVQEKNSINFVLNDLTSFQESFFAEFSTKPDTRVE